MLFRHKSPPTSVATRFRAEAALFSSSVERGLHVVRIAAGMARSIELLHALTAHLPPVVDLSVECLRSQRRFVGDGLNLGEVRETIARLKVPLLASGGVELAVFNADDQLVLSAMLDLWIYSRSDRWVYLLVGEGLEQVEAIAPRGWSVARDEFTGAPDLVAAVQKAAERLTLREA